MRDHTQQVPHREACVCYIELVRFEPDVCLHTRHVCIGKPNSVHIVDPILQANERKNGQIDLKEFSHEAIRVELALGSLDSCTKTLSGALFVVNRYNVIACKSRIKQLLFQTVTHFIMVSKYTYIYVNVNVNT